MIIKQKNGRNAFKEYELIVPKPPIENKDTYLEWVKSCGEWARKNGFQVHDVEQLPE